MEKRKQKNKTSFLLILPLSALVLLEAAVATPLTRILSSNVDYQGGILYTLLDSLVIVMHFSFYWIAFSGAVFSKEKKTLPVCAYAFLTFWRYPLNLLSSLIVIPPDGDYDFFTDSLPSLGIEIGMDLLQIGVILAVFAILSKKDAFSTAKMIPLMAGLPVFLEILMRIRYDVYWGVSDFSSVVWMILYYGFDVMCFFLGRFFLIKWKTVWDRGEPSLPEPNRDA